MAPLRTKSCGLLQLAFSWFTWPLSYAGNLNTVVRVDADSPFTSGQMVGISMRDSVQRATASAVAELGDYLRTPRGAFVFSTLMTENRQAYPDVYAEYEGIAYGAGVSSKDIFVAALANELQGFAKQAGISTKIDQKSCTDYHSMDQAGELRAWGHNEDSAPHSVEDTFLVEATLPGFQYVGFAYAPNVVGWAWAFNSYGLAQSVNALYPLSVTIGIGVNFLARDVLNARSLDDAIKRACVPGLASGQTFNIGSIHEKDHQIVIETSPMGCTVTHLRAPSKLVQEEPPIRTLIHCNLYESQRLKGLDGGPSSWPSSEHRLSRLRSMTPAASPSAIGDALSDNWDPEWPVHRNGRYPDTSKTFNTVIFDAVKESVEMWGEKAPNRTSAVRAYNWTTLQRVEPTGQHYTVIIS